MLNKHNVYKNLPGGPFLLILSILLLFLVMEVVLHLPLFNNYFDRDITDFYYIEDDKMVFFREQRIIDFENITSIYLMTLSYTCGNTNLKNCNIRICENPEVKDNNNFRVVFIGDSVTYAMNFGIANPDKIFSSMISRILKNKSVNSTKFEVFNYAVPGSNLNDIAFFYNFASKCNPDLVIYGYFQNDRSYYSYYTIKALPYLKFKYSNKWYHKSRTLLVFQENFWHIIDNCQNGYPLKCSLKNLNYQEAETILDGIRYGNNDTKFYIINFPRIKEAYPTDDFVETYSKKNGVKYLDVRKEFLEKGIDPLTLRASPEDIAHYGYYGQEIIAGLIYEDLIKYKLIPLYAELENNSS